MFRSHKITLGDIGDNPRTVEFEPVEEPGRAPIHEPAPAPAQPAPVPSTPTPEKEPVPA